MTKKIFIQICCLAALLALPSCNNQDDLTNHSDDYGTITVGGLSMGNVVTSTSTRANNDDAGQEASVGVDAETIPWLKAVLENGLEITYSNQYDHETGIMKDGTTKTAKLQYHADTKKYSFLYTDNNKPAEWMGNGIHIFEGKYIPSKLITDVPADITEDQSSDINDNDNYNLLTRYTCMVPFPKSQIAATVNQISLPFQHRLARVIVQVVIDDDVKADYTDPSSPKAVILGYDKDNNGGGRNCTLRFCNVQVLKDVKADGTPEWSAKDAENKVVPHFIEERASVDVTTYDEEENATTNTYYNVPTFDLIVRPTYFDRAAPMTDEPDADMDDDNHIFFSVTLNNGMIYEQAVKFDLNPNEQTTITLHITREGINVNDAGTDNWIESKHDDGYYGIDNELGHNLSDAGSCWQRAYQISDDQYNVTDGSNPKGPEDISQNTQYLTKAQFIEALKEAKEGGAHHGDYFILTGDLTLDDWTPFEFTGHLDGRHHHLTLPAGVTSLFTSLNGNYTAPVGTANINSDNSPMPGYRGEILNLYISNPNANLVEGQNTGFIYNCHLTGTGHFCEDNTAGNTTGQVVDCTPITNKP